MVLEGLFGISFENYTDGYCIQERVFHELSCLFFFRRGIVTIMNLFEENLSALRQSRPELAARVESLPSTESCHLIETSSGAPSLEIIDESGRRVLWHSRRDPLREAEREIASIDRSRVYLPLFAGIGLGYTLRMVWDRRRDEFFDLIALEHDPQIFRLAMSAVRLGDIFLEPRVRIYVGPDPGAWPAMVESLLPAIMSCHLQTIPHPPSQRCFPSFYQTMFSILKDRVQRTKAEFDLMIRSGVKIQENLWRNLSPAVNAAGLHEAKNILQGKPAVVVAAGPSLDRNVHHLKDARDGCAIVAVDTAYRTLKQCGIEPHIVVSTDPTELNRRHFEGIQPAPETILAFDPEVDSGIPNQWPRRRLFLNLEKCVWTRWLEKVSGPYGYLPKGGSVGHTAFYLARVLGADPILFIGLDLAFSPEGGKTHASASALAREHGTIEPGVDSAPLGPREGTGVMRESIVWVPGVTGERLPTSRIMAIYIGQFQEEFKRTPARLIDATEGGARLEGAEILPLREAVGRFVNPAENITERFAAIQVPIRDRKQLREEISRISAALQASKPEAVKGLDRCRALAQTTIQGQALTACPEWREMEDCFSNLHQAETLKIALEQALFSAVYFFIQKERPEETTLRLSKYRNYFESFLALQPVFLDRINKP